MTRALITGMNITTLTSKQLRKIINLKVQIEKLTIKLEKLAGEESSTPAKTTKTTPKRKGGMSVAGRARVAAAQRARWAKLKGKKSVKPVKKARRKMSAAGRARIAAAQKARWAKIKGAKPSAKPAKKKFTMSAAAKAKISAAAKLRWAKIKAAKK